MDIDKYTEQVKEQRKPLPNASNYELDPDGFVYRKGKRLRLRKQGQHWFAQVYDNNGKAHFFDSERLARVMFGDKELTLRREDIEDNYKVRTVPDFPRYVVTSYGAIYCIDPPKRGRNAGTCYLVHESLSKGKPYVTLYQKDGTCRRKQVAWVVKQAW